jgi:hypothetical protein
MSLPVSEMMKINFILKSHIFPISEIVEWILSVCLNIHTLTLPINWETPNSLHNEIARLKKLKKLDVTVDEASELKEVTLTGFRITKMLLTIS